MKYCLHPRRRLEANALFARAKQAHAQANFPAAPEPSFHSSELYLDWNDNLAAIFEANLKVETESISYPDRVCPFAG